MSDTTAAPPPSAETSPAETSPAETNTVAPAGSPPPASTAAPVRTLAHVPWMEIPGVRAVVWALGRENVRFIGGCVRDHLLGRPSLDVDIATALPPDQSLARLKQAGVMVKPIGFEHGTVVAITRSGSFQITSLRRDVETDGRHAIVAFTDDWVEDANRRDFTINALSVDPDGNLYDPHGGLKDLEAGLVRFIGEPAERLAEDRLRLLRFFRFSAWYSPSGLDKAGVAACAAAADGLDQLSGERLSAELRRLFAAPAPTTALSVMAEHDILRAITSIPLRPRTLARLLEVEQATAQTPEPILRLAACLPAAADAYRALAERLRFSKAEAAKLGALARPLPDLGETPEAIRQAMYQGGERKRFIQRTLLAAAEGDVRHLNTRLEEANAWAWPKFPISGLDLLDLGVKPGPNIGTILHLVEDWWVKRDFQPDRDACMGAIQKALAKRA